MFAATRSRRGGLALLVALLCASAAAPASGAVPGDYTVSRYDGGPSPDRGLGAQLANIGDVDADGKNDLAIGNPGADDGRGDVVVLSGSSGSVIWHSAAPAGAAESSDDEQPLMFGSRVAVLGDVASCGAPDQQSAGTDCGRRAIADGVPELLVSALGGDSGPSVDQGRVYVLDGRTGAIHRRLRIGNSDLPSEGRAAFGYAIGSAGDLDEDGEPEAAVGAPGYTETFDSAPGSCEDNPGSGIGTCEGAGRVYLFPSAQLGGPAPSGDPSSDFVTDNVVTPPALVQNPDARAEIAGSTSEERFGAAVSAFGSAAGQLLIGAPLTDLAGVSDTGAVYLADAVTGSTVSRIDSPGLQPGAHFGAALWAGLSSHSIVGAPGIGSAYRIDVATGTSSSAFFDSDATGAGFGESVVRLPGDMTGVGSPGRPPSGAVRIFNPDGTLAQTVCDPDGQAGAAFGASVASLGDANGDGFDELAIGAPGFDHLAAANAGRVYLLTSKGGGAADANVCVPSSPGGSDSGGGSGGGSSGGSGGGSTAGPSKGGGTVVTARVLRRLVLKPNRKRVRKSRSFRLRGKLRASANRSVCQKRQKIALQRRVRRGRYQTFDVAVTRASGAFTARERARRTYVYRARVSQTARCMGAVSKTARVRVLRKRGRR